MCAVISVTSFATEVVIFMSIHKWNFLAMVVSVGRYMRERVLVSKFRFVVCMILGVLCNADCMIYSPVVSGHNVKELPTNQELE